ncbi:TerB N-terminal domain-containing protein [Pseudomonas sp. NEEL19]|uniref:tellurite resistance TerB family protein n=1 Tax=Pseudomonas sp. NEEL19 TaxID=2867409 RepID=UPI00236827EF|nr:TerB N-terminal domain-containing protein [Pseudomonas sp. NEEL19]WDM57191.1 TerB N-terminal domain-containing protein [Pseudomonas sp. NEEL19]
MPRKRKGSGGGPIALYALLFVVALLAQVPKQVWIALGVILGIGVLVWALRRATQAKPDVPEYDIPAQTVASSPQTPAVTAQFSASTHERGFHTVQVGSTRDSQTYAIPKPSAKPMGVRWLAENDSINVAGLAIPGGLLYITERATQFGQSEPSLIDATLRVARSPMNLTERQMPYWPSYRSITPEARRAYLQWLAGGRRQPADAGYVFLFFYGLERRTLIDAPSDPQAMAEIPAIKAEVKRLLGLYGDNNSFRGYATRFLAHVDAGSVQPQSYMSEPTASAADGYELPMSLRVALGQMAVDKYPLNPSWALAWALAEPNIPRRTPVTRCPEQFAALFKNEFAKRYPNGIVLPQNKTKLKIAYRPASAGLSIPAVALGDLPDVAATSGTRNKLQVIVEDCTTVLDAYSRYLGRNPDAEDSLEAILQLPTELWPADAKSELEQLEQRVGGETLCMSFGELAGRFKSAGALSRDKVVALARALESKRIGLEPDVLSGSRTPKAEDTIALFASDSDEGTLRATDAYSAAAVTLDLASAVAAADGDTSLEEISLLSGHIDSWDHLCVAHRKRLKAHLQIQLKQPPTLASLKKKLEPLTLEAKRKIASFLAHLAHADGEVTPQEVKLLERVYKTLALDPQCVYSDLHSAAVRPSQVVEAMTSTATLATAAEASEGIGSGFALDMGKVARLQQETAEVSALLASVFNEESPTETSGALEPEAPQEQEGSSAEQLATVHGLDVEHSAFLRLLVSRTEWSRAELEDAASDMELMLDGALERINDTAFELFDMPVTEGDDPIEINPEILDELAL